uniref:Invertebrate defensins family profile domain-containing protein n=1 Tax=Schistosoma curassoni TaxID=6186 RepID=A0A183L2N6_9TREM
MAGLLAQLAGIFGIGGGYVGCKGGCSTKFCSKGTFGIIKAFCSKAAVDIGSTDATDD